MGSFNLLTVAGKAIKELTGLEYDTNREYMKTIGHEDEWFANHICERVRSEIIADCQNNIAPKYKKFDLMRTKLSTEETHSLCAEATMAFGRRITELYGYKNMRWELKILPMDAVDKFYDQFVDSSPDEEKKYLDDFSIKVDRETFLAKMRNILFDQLSEMYDYPADRK